MNLTIPAVEKRLQDRYQRLVQEHTGHAHAVATGPRLLPDEPSTHAAAMAAWRFYLNPRTTFSRLAQPLLEAARQGAVQHCRQFALVPLDWTKLNYLAHPSKTDRAPLGHRLEVGYKLLSALLLSDADGKPLAPVCAQLLTAEGLLSSRFDRPRQPLSVLDELAPVMKFVDSLGLGRRPVFVIDAEADSVYHYRRWCRRHLVLVRADAERYATWKGQEWRLPQIAGQLQQESVFRRTRQVEHEGRKLWQHVAEAAVTLTRPGVLKRVIDGKEKRLVKRGKPLAMRLVVSELRDEAGVVVERWYLLTNVPKEIDTETIALWYYWRWKIETFYKLLKGAGHHLEHWQQENGRHVLKRLLVASMACVLAWRLGHSTVPGAEQARELVMRLSGRQLEHGKQFTLEGLLAGTWVLLAASSLLEQVPADEVRRLADFVRRGATGPDAAHAPPRREAG
jgi:hypothetical protein